MHKHLCRIYLYKTKSELMTTDICTHLRASSKKRMAFLDSLPLIISSQPFTVKPCMKQWHNRIHTIYSQILQQEADRSEHLLAHRTVRTDILLISSQTCMKKMTPKTHKAKSQFYANMIHTYKICTKVCHFYFFIVLKNSKKIKNKNVFFHFFKKEDKTNKQTNKTEKKLSFSQKYVQQLLMFH